MTSGETREKGRGRHSGTGLDGLDNHGQLCYRRPDV